MITRLHLKNFKNFKDATLELGQFTVLAGENGSGKSNILDALMLLQALASGKSVAEATSARSLRGGPRYLAYHGSQEVELVVSIRTVIDSEEFNLTYCVCLFLRAENGWAIRKEYLVNDSASQLVFQADFDETHRSSSEPMLVHLNKDDYDFDDDSEYATDTELSLLRIHAMIPSAYEGDVTDQLLDKVISILIGMVLLHPNTTLLRVASPRAVQRMEPNGVNMPSALYSIASTKDSISAWMSALLPDEVKEIRFITSEDDLVSFIVDDLHGRAIPMYSLSDGTLIYLAYLASVFSTKEPRLLAIEEIENGLHPSRLHLLMDLFERVGKERGLQVLATTHSPTVMNLLSQEAREYAAFTYKRPEFPDARILKVKDLVGDKQGEGYESWGAFMESRWFEGAAYFADERDAES